MKKSFLKNEFIQQGVIKVLMIQDDIDEFYNIMSALPSSYCDIAFDKKNYTIPLDLKLLKQELEQIDELLMIHSIEPTLKEVFLTLTKEES